MPRLPPSLLRHAASLSPHLPLLLRPTRNLALAHSELRWLRAHAASSPLLSLSLTHLVARRARGEPLQYILGSQPFGPLDILCRRGVLIPRPETEASTAHLASQLLALPSLPQQLPPLRILDLCTGTGCIALLLAALLKERASRVVGVDISRMALALARANLAHNIALGHLPSSAAVDFVRGDVLASGLAAAVGGEFDVVISNPPYVSRRGFERETGRSVRNWEPESALVPEEGEEDGDGFYARIVGVAEEVGAKTVLMEVGGAGQAGRVVRMVEGRGKDWRVRVWRDAPDLEVEGGVVEEGLEGVSFEGVGMARSVVCWRD